MSDDNSVFVGVKEKHLILICVPPRHFKLFMSDLKRDEFLVEQILCMKMGVA